MVLVDFPSKVPVNANIKSSSQMLFFKTMLISKIASKKERRESYLLSEHHYISQYITTY
jgi:hypothetical protein